MHKIFSSTLAENRGITVHLTGVQYCPLSSDYGNTVTLCLCQSWDRLPYVTDIREPGVPSTIPAVTEAKNNFIVAKYAAWFLSWASIRLLVLTPVVEYSATPQTVDVWTTMTDPHTTTYITTFAFTAVIKVTSMEIASERTTTLQRKYTASVSMSKH